MIPFYAIFCTLRVRDGNRVKLEIPCNAPRRAKLLRRRLKAGRVEGGKVLVEGAQLPAALRAVGYPDAVVRASERYAATIGTRGVQLSPDVVEERTRAAELLYAEYLLAHKSA